VGAGRALRRVAYKNVLSLSRTRENLYATERKSGVGDWRCLGFGAEIARRYVEEGGEVAILCLNGGHERRAEVRLSPLWSAAM
jgi:hypothetical protein